MNTANKEPVHLDGETVKWDETIESLRGAIGQADDAVADANLCRDEWVKKGISLSGKSPSSCEEKEQETILKLLMEAKVSASKWVKAISYALTMRRRAELIVDTLLPIIGEEVERKALTAVKARSKWLEAKWQPTLADVEMVSQYTTEAVQRWKAATLSSRGLGKRLDARSAYQTVEKVYQIAGWHVGWYTNWGGSQAYREKFSQDLFSFQFTLDRFSLPHEIRDMLLQLEARSSPLFKAYSLNAIPCSVGELVEISQAETTKNVQKAIFTADKEIARMIHSIDRSPVNSIAPLLTQKDNILTNLANVKNWACHWEQVITSVGNAIWQIVQATDVLLPTVGQEEEQKAWIEIKNEAKKQFQSWYPYMYGIKKLYDHTVEAEANQRYLPKGNFASWYPYTFSVTTEEEKNAIEAILCIRHQFNWMFWDYKRDNKGWKVKWNQNHFAQISQDWTLFEAKLLEPGMPSSRLFVDTQNQDNWLSPSLHFMENPPSLNIEQEIVRWIKMTIPRANQWTIRAIRFMKKWPQNKEVSLLKANESLEILMEMENLASDWRQVISTAREAIQEMIIPLQMRSITSENDTYEEQAEEIRYFWDSCIISLSKLLTEIKSAEAKWQILANSKKTPTVEFSLNSASACETKVSVSPSAKIHVNTCVSLNPGQVHHTWSWQQKDSDLITDEEQQAINCTRNVVDSARRLWLFDKYNKWGGSIPDRFRGYLTGQRIDDYRRLTLNSNGQIERTTRTSWTKNCISYDWMRLRYDLLNL
jgi:hypothetical protein